MGTRTRPTLPAAGGRGGVSRAGPKGGRPSRRGGRSTSAGASRWDVGGLSSFFDLFFICSIPFFILSGLAAQNHARQPIHRCRHKKTAPMPDEGCCGVLPPCENRDGRCAGKGKSVLGRPLSQKRARGDRTGDAARGAPARGAQRAARATAVRRPPGEKGAPAHGAERTPRVYRR